MVRVHNPNLDHELKFEEILSILNDGDTGILEWRKNQSEGWVEFDF